MSYHRRNGRALFAARYGKFCRSGNPATVFLPFPSFEAKPCLEKTT
jgi:hypothetical protein